LAANDLANERFERACADEVLKGPQPVAFFIDTDLHIEESKQQALTFLGEGWNIIIVVTGSALDEEDFGSDPLGVSGKHAELLKFRDRLYWVDSFPYDPLELVRAFSLRCLFSDVEHWPPLEHPVLDCEDVEVKEFGFFKRRATRPQES